LVSHDRTLLNNVVSRTFALEGEGKVCAYAGGYDDWLSQRPQPASAAPESERTASSRVPPPAASRPRRINFQEQRELDALPERIETLEAEQAQLYAALADSRLYQENGSEVARIQTRLDALACALEAAYQRWEELETLPR
jgi:ATP-binding cassette subfamily F protein uup